jgi:outer membrane receptor protein involved in Fe transport
VRPPESREIYEGHLRGPVGHGGHTNFILSSSFRQRNTAVAVNAVGPKGLIQENVLAPSRNSQATLRVTHDFSAVHRLSMGYNFESSSNNNAGVGGIVLPEAGYSNSSREDDAIFNDRIIITPNFINQLQVTLEKDEDVTVSLTNAQAIKVSGSFTGGGAQADSSRTENTIHINEVMSWNHGMHYISFGVQLPQFSRRAVDDHTNRLGTFKFGSIADYNNNTPYAFTAQQGIGRGLYWMNEAGGFIQDQIKLNPKVQLSLGVRYDWQTFLADDNNISPRASLSYAPGSGKTILRLGAGLFYDRTGGDFPAAVKLHDGVVLHSVQLLNPSFPLPPGTNFASVPSTLVRFDPKARAPYSIQYSFGVERQLQKSVTVTAAYRGSVQVKSFRSVDVNAPVLPLNPSLTANYPRPDPNLGQVQQIESGGRALLNAFDLSFRGSAGRIFSGQAQYTLSKFMNNTGGINSFPQDQYHPNAEWGRADQDRLQRFNLIGNINPDHWLTMGVDATFYSGPPYSETTGDDNYHTGMENARPGGVARNSRQAGGTADLDLQWNHDFRIGKAKGDKAKIVSCSFSAFNALNRTNFTNYIGARSSSLFAHPTTALPGRQLQFAVGYRF